MEIEEKKVYDTKCRLFLSEKDEYVPITHIGIYSLFRNEANTAIYISESRCQSMRYKTYTSTMELFKKYEAPTYCQFFNYNSEALVKLGKNYFSTHDNFAPIAELVEAFSHKVETNSIPAIAISYGIDKIVLKSYIECVKKGYDFWESPPVSVLKRKKNESKKRDLIMFGEEEIKMDYWSSIHLPRNPLYHRFVDWCKIQNVMAYEGALMAMEYLMDAYPAESLEDVAIYDRIDELDIPIYGKPRENSKKVFRSLVLSGKVVAQSEKIIERYNRDPKNMARKIDFDLYCSNALHLMNQNIDLEYRDPDLYDEEMMLNEAEDYNKKLFLQVQENDLPKQLKNVGNKNKSKKLKQENK